MISIFRFSILFALCLLAATPGSAAPITPPILETGQDQSLVFVSFATLGTPFDGIPAQAALTLTSGVIGGGAVGDDSKTGFSGAFISMAQPAGISLISGTFGSSGDADGSDAGRTTTFQDGGRPRSEVDFTQGPFAFSLSNVTLTLERSDSIDRAAGAGTETIAAARPDTATKPATLTTIGLALVGVGVFLRKRLS